MDTYGMDLMGRRRRRRHSAEFKAAVIQECMRPGVSMAAVALAHSLNANMLRKWVIDAESALPPKPKAAPAQDVPTPGASRRGRGAQRTKFVCIVAQEVFFWPFRSQFVRSRPLRGCTSGEAPASCR